MRNPPSTSRIELQNGFIEEPNTTISELDRAWLAFSVGRRKIAPSGGEYAHHLGEPALVVLQVYEVAIPEFLAPVGHSLRNNMGVGVDLQHGMTSIIRQISEKMRWGLGAVNGNYELDAGHWN